MKSNPKHRKLRKEFIFTCVLLLTLLCVLLFCLVRLTTGRPDYDDFLDALAMAESSDQYDAVNRYGYLGRYQMGELALREAEFLDENGNWTAVAKSYGIASKADFLNSPEGQDAAILACHKRVWGYIRHYGLDDYVGKTYQGIRVTDSGLLAACHLVGTQAMRQALKNDEPSFDANRMSAAEYMERFADYGISAVQ